MTPSYRVAIALAACAGALTLAGPTAAVPLASPPPQCSAADTLREATLTAGPLARGYARFCGTGEALIRVGGTAFTIAGGHCSKPGSTRWTAFGLLGTGPSPPRGLGMSLIVKPGNQPGRVSVLEAIVQAAGLNLQARGRAVVSKSLGEARFTIVTRESPRTRISGSWTCAG